MVFWYWFRVRCYLQQCCSPSYIWELGFYSQMENTCMTTLFLKERRFGTIKLV